MARAGDILVRTMDLLAAKVRPGRDDRGARQRGREVHPLAGRDACLQGLPRLPGLDLRFAERHGGARHPGEVQALARGRPERRHRRRVRRLGGGRRPHVRSRRGLAGGREAAPGHPGVAVPSRRAVPGRQPARRRRPRRAGARRGRRVLDRALAGRPRDRARHARGAPDPQLRHAGQGHPARGGHGARRRADDHRRPAHGPDGRRRLGDLLAGRLARRPLRVHRRDHRRRPAHPHALARVQGARRRRPSSARAARRRTSTALG